MSVNARVLYLQLMYLFITYISPFFLIFRMRERKRKEEETVETLHNREGGGGPGILEGGWGGGSGSAKGRSSRIFKLTSKAKNKKTKKTELH